MAIDFPNRLLFEGRPFIDTNTQRVWVRDNDLNRWVLLSSNHITFEDNAPILLGPKDPTTDPTTIVGDFDMTDIPFT